MNDRFDLTGSVALVTGGTTGLGRAASHALGDAGAKVMVTSRSGPRGLDTEMAALGCELDCVAVDLARSKQTDCEDLVERVLQRFGRLDILVNNAGSTARGPAIALGVDEWHRVLHLNLTIPFLLSRVAARHMLAQSKGSIVNVASLLSFQGGLNVAAYTASKSGLAGLTRALANEWAAGGVRVNAIAPGYMETDLTTALRRNPDRNRSISERIPLQRWGQPADVGGAIVYLASAASAYVTGTILAVDGGWLAR